MDGDEFDYDVNLLVKPEVFVYKIPPRAVQGHTAADWKACIWQGRLELKSIGKELVLSLIDVPTGQLYAECPIPQSVETALERCIDSSRYFAIKVVSAQRHAFIGIGFDSRNDAFDLNAAISDFYNRQVTTKKEIVAPALADMKFKENEQIVINFPGCASQTVTKTTSAANDNDVVFALQPPPCETGSRTRGSNAPSSLSVLNSNGAVPQTGDKKKLNVKSNKQQSSTLFDDFSFMSPDTRVLTTTSSSVSSSSVSPALNRPANPSMFLPSDAQINNTIVQDPFASAALSDVVDPFASIFPAFSSPSPTIQRIGNVDSERNSQQQQDLFTENSSKTSSPPKSQPFSKNLPSTSASTMNSLNNKQKVNELPSLDQLFGLASISKTDNAQPSASSNGDNKNFSKGGQKDFLSFNELF